MKKLHKYDLEYDGLLKSLTINCEKCCGLCCVALYCAKTEGFPQNKEAGKACINLNEDFGCAIHSQLSDKKMKGCLAYDCMGAGQKVTQNIFAEVHWKNTPKIAEKMFQVFVIVHQLHQMLGYLVEASSIMVAVKLKRSEEIHLLINENETMTQLSINEILNLEIEEYRNRVNVILKKVGELVQVTIPSRKGEKESKDYFGKNFKKANLEGKDFSMALLIAANLEGCNLFGANFLGTDMRDTNIKNVDLSESIFLTQMQVNAAKGNHNTKLPFHIVYPESWEV